ncbi:S8 family peptidase [Paenibacillus sp. BAC0078]
MKIKVKLGISAVVIIMLSLLIYSTEMCLFKEDIDISKLNAEQIVPWGISSINAPTMWAHGFSGEKVRVAIMDSGVIFNHPDLRDNLKKGINIIHPSELPLDNNGHGTLVTGVISANNNNYGVVGVAPDAEIYPVKVLDQKGYGDINDIVKGIEWCIQNKMQIINMSFSVDEDNISLHRVIRKAIDAGIIIVASASNSYGGEVGFPASYDEVISVTSVDINLVIDKRAPRGKVDFSAPGVDVISTSMNGQYAKLSGTSLATPYITGIVALILEYQQNLGIRSTRFNILSELRSMSRHLGERGSETTYGYGFVEMKI